MRIKKTFTQSLTAAAATVLLGTSATSAQAALVGRDIAGVAVAAASASAVFLYDTDLNITWMRNANAAAGTSFDNGVSTADGHMTWANANNWAAALTVGTFSGWRLPTTLQPDPSCSFQVDAGPPVGLLGSIFGCTGSEMGHLWYTELGNSAETLTNTGDFQQLLPYIYWSGTEVAVSPTAFAWFFYQSTGYQNGNPKDVEFMAMAVRAGDVLVDVNRVPEPGTLLLAALALAGIGAVRTRRPLGASAL